MANFVQVKIVCPCGALLDTRKCNADSGSTTRGTKKCGVCKKNVSYQITGGQAYTSYKK